MENQKEDQLKVLTKYFMDKFSIELLLDERAPQNNEEKRAKDYFYKLTDIGYLFNRLLNYDIYFQYFYPNTDKISADEVVEYHIQSYIQDFFLLKERLYSIINSLKKDLVNCQITNIGEVKHALNHLKNKVEESLQSGLNLRDIHTHERTISDLDILKARLIRMTYRQEILKQKYKDLIDKAKEKYIKQAINNKMALNELKDYFSLRFGYIFSSMSGDDSSLFQL